jgi:UPF0755 protein
LFDNHATAGIPRLFKFLKSLAALLGAVAVAVALWMGWYVTHPVALRSASVDFSIKPGSGLRAAARQAQEQGVDLDIERFVVLGRILGRAANIKAGSYEIFAGITPLALLDKLTAGDVLQSGAVLIEGWTFREFREALAQNPDLQHDSKDLRDTDIMQRIGAPGEFPEGRFFPDTYLFAKGSSDIAVLRRAHRTMQKNLAGAWESRDPSLSLATPYEALILASIVEKETGKATDRALVAGVFINRLRLGMLLQTDPTVIYGMGARFDGNLRRRDLEQDTPYNSYVRAGLPPTPIAMPGLASIFAATHPAKTEMLYFVSRGDGSSQFSRSLADHNRAVQKYQLSGRH